MGERRDADGLLEVLRPVPDPRHRQDSSTGGLLLSDPRVLIKDGRDVPILRRRDDRARREKLRDLPPRIGDARERRQVAGASDRGARWEFGCLEERDGETGLQGGES
jgi:hypothetical protein